MAENTKIQWCHHTFNPWRGCTKVSPGCEHCYADAMSKRNPSVLGVWGKYGSRVIASEAQWKLPVKWNKEAEAAGERRRVFCASLADVFEGNATLPDNTYYAIRDARKRLFALISATPNLDWLLLTKRPEFVDIILTEDIAYDGILSDDFPNVWIGTTVENQKYADERIPELLKIPAKVRFLSVEPMLEAIDLEKKYRQLSWNHAVYPLEGYYAEHGNIDENGHPMYDGHQWTGNRIDWVIVGGESGGKARPFDVTWARSIIEQCKTSGVPVFVKQLGAQPISSLNTDFAGKLPVRLNQPLHAKWQLPMRDRKGGDISEWPEDLRVRQMPEVSR